MVRENVSDLGAFQAAARARGSTRAAVPSGVFQPALSLMLPELKARFGCGR